MPDLCSWSSILLLTQSWVSDSGNCCILIGLFGDFVQYVMPISATHGPASQDKLQLLLSEYFSNILNVVRGVLWPESYWFFIVYCVKWQTRTSPTWRRDLIRNTCHGKTYKTGILMLIWTTVMMKKLYNISLFPIMDDGWIAPRLRRGAAQEDLLF